MVRVCVICAVRTVKVWVTFCGIAQLIQSRARVSLASWEGGSRAVLSTVSLGLLGVRSTVQALRLPFEYYY